LTALAGGSTPQQHIHQMPDADRVISVRGQHRPLLQSTQARTGTPLSTTRAAAGQ